MLKVQGLGCRFRVPFFALRASQGKQGSGFWVIEVAGMVH